jgi:DNA-binding LytR/AlgR family response regulator
VRILIVDDEPLALERLRACLELIPEVELVGSAIDGDDAQQRIADLKPDLVLLDIQMPGRSGIAVTRALAQAQVRPEIVFVTAFTDFALEAFALDAADYILKPVRFDRVQEAIRRAGRRLQAARNTGIGGPPLVPAPVPDDPGYHDAFWIKQRDGFIRLDVNQIRRIEAARDYALLHTASRTYILRTTMGELERRLNPAQLIRVHRSAFVRLDLVRRVERNGRNLMRLQTEDGAMVDVGASYAARVVSALGLDRSPGVAAH